MDPRQQLKKEILRFILVSVITLILSTAGLIIFSLTGKYIIHTSIYIAGVIMGLGWLSTALTLVLKR
ncbi:MAG: hypothetical protein MR639_07425 [Clostridium sp.]|uniref:hypothetical protein n=1 Tax=Clostridium sp. TaxID=1506 RepID=UPI002A8EA0BC|nr:hypothetical protein [Clostridium sp.]MDY5096904.1 hypothetical protein [Clostridium sp.]